jgi:hypothetical protein
MAGAADDVRGGGLLKGWRCSHQFDHFEPRRLEELPIEEVALSGIEWRGI